MLEGIIYTVNCTRTAVVVKYLQEHKTVVTKLLLHKCMGKCIKCKFQRRRQVFSKNASTCY